MSTIDLDIDNYSITDLQQFFKLKKKFTVKDVEYQEAYIREQLLSSGHIHQRFKADLINFLQLAKNRIIHNRFGPPETPTQIPHNWKLDTLNVPISREPINREQELISHPNKTFIQANNSEFHAGTLNPLNTRIISKYITIDTRFRDNLSNNTYDFNIQLPTRLNKVVSMQLTALEMPMNFYSISANYGNNYLYISAKQQFFENGPITKYETVLIVPDGNYSNFGLAEKINQLLAPTDGDGNLMNPDNVFAYVRANIDMDKYGTGTGKFFIQTLIDTELGNSIICLGLDFSRDFLGKPDNVDITTKLGWNLGFTGTTYCGSNVYFSDTPVQITTMKYFYLGIEDFQHNGSKLFLNAYHNTVLNDNILARISLNDTPNFTNFSKNDYNLITEPRIYFGPVDIQKLRIQLFDDHGRALDTNFTNFSFVLLFKMVYDL